ncbi:uncharacterized protein ACRADG_003709 isoform 2-T3 [Cochliomyia hominivorax]
MVIQRGWKILSDTGSTSASSTEANRSPMGGLNSSSDDSNCSNQTTHSMVTSVASPPNSSIKVDTSSITVNNYNHNITTNTSLQHQQQTPNETMKFVTTPQMAENTLQKLRQRFSNTTPLTNSSAESGMRSLELVRIAVQSAFDKEIDGMVKHFIELQKMSCALLENAKSQYKILRHKPQLSSTSNTITTLTTMSENSNVRMALKRPALNKSSTLIEMQKRFFPDNIILKTSTQQSSNQQQHTQTQVLPSVDTIKSTLTQNLHNNGATFVSQQHPTLQQHQTTNAVESTQQPQQQQSQQAPPQQQILHPRRQIFWNTANISTTTKFILDVQANQAFGFGTEGKERLASKHPELIRYLPDSEDRDWLVNQQIIPQQNRNSRFLFLIYDEVRRLYQTHDVYKNKSSIDLSVMMTFTVPDFMIQKMKLFFVDLNIKSRGLITNSYSIAAPTPSSTIQQTQEQPNSHLRNALLLGTQQSSSSSSSNNTTKTTNMATTSDLTSSTAASTSSSASSSSITSTESLLYQKSKASNLSSSHATLTALLNNSSSANTSMNSNNSTINKSTNISSSSASATPTLVNKLRK